MGAKKFGAVMGVLVEQIVRLITENYTYDEMTASNEFYNSPSASGRTSGYRSGKEIRFPGRG